MNWTGVERVRAVTWWKAAAVAVTMVAGSWMGAMDAPGARPSLPAVKTQQQVEQEMLDAVKLLLKNVPKQDQPKRLVSAKKEGDNRYLVHIEMVQGDGWFILTWNGSTWTAMGTNPPPS